MIGVDSNICTERLSGFRLCAITKYKLLGTANCSPPFIVRLDNLHRAGVQPPLRILTGTIRASTICCIAELATYFFEQSFPLPCRAITFDNFPGATIGVAFRGVIPYADTYCESAWNKDPVFGVIGIQTGPRG